jgi:glycosyltransferase involved in cell wall biosynthesis
MRLAIVSLMTGVPWGGSEELWAAAAREALARGWSVEALLPGWPSVPEKVKGLEQAGVRVKHWAMHDPSRVARAKNRLLGRTVTDLVRRSVNDALVVSLGSAWDIAGYPSLCDYLRDRRKPYVLIAQHNYETPLQAWAKPRVDGVYERATRAVFVSERNLRSAERQRAARFTNAVVLQNPVNLSSLYAVPWPKESPTARFACVARLEVAAKGQDMLLEALAAPEWRSRGWRLSLVGEGPDREYLAKLAAMYGLTDRVVFTGQVKDLSAMWAEQDVLVLPSRSEGTPLALVEAQIAGRPAVVTDVGDSAKWVAEGETGFVADAATAASLGRALERSWSARAQWRAMGTAAHASTAARLDPTPGRTLIDLIEKTMKARQD